MSRTNKIAWSVSLMAVGLTGASALAGTAVSNGGFENGDFAGWDTRGIASVVPGSFGITPTQGTHEAVLTNGLPGEGEEEAGLEKVSEEPPAADAGDIESFLGLAPNRLDALAGPDNEATSGAAIRQDISLASDGTLSFDWNLLSSEGESQDDFPDFAFWSLVDHNTGEVLGSVDNASFTASDSLFLDETGFQTTTEDVEAGDYTLGFGILNVNDEQVSSGLVLDNVQVTGSTPGEAVPTPSAAAAGLVLLGGLAAMRRRRRAA